MKYLLIVLMFFPVAVIVQEKSVFKLSTKAVRTTEFANGWIALDSGWKFKAGDNLDWANPGFDASSWGSINLFKDLNNAPDILPKSGIVWVRIQLKTDSTLLNR